MPFTLICYFAIKGIKDRYPLCGRKELKRMNKIVKIVVLLPDRKPADSDSNHDIDLAVKKAVRLPCLGRLCNSGKTLTVRIYAN